MLNVVEYLRTGKTFTDLEAEFGIKSKPHPSEPLVILNYDQIESPKTHPIVRECRGLVLHSETFDVVAKGFDRFFNEGEAYELTKDFDWTRPVDVRTKEDGSYINLFRFDEKVFITTRGSWADGECGFSGKTWAEIVDELLPNRFDPATILPGVNMIFELCTIHNKVVRSYPEPKLVLLGITHCGYEQHPNSVDSYAKIFGFERPEKFICPSIDAVQALITHRSSNDATWEGLVLRDANGMRLKVKSATYVALHHMRGEGDNLFNPKYIIPFILKGEAEEVLTYFPEIEEKLNEVGEAIGALWLELGQFFCKVTGQGITDQKKFALAVKDCRLSSILFRLKKENRLTFKELDAEFRSDPVRIHKILYR